MQANRTVTETDGESRHFISIHFEFPYIIIFIDHGKCLGLVRVVSSFRIQNRTGFLAFMATDTCFPVNRRIQETLSVFCHTDGADGTYRITCTTAGTLGRCHQVNMPSVSLHTSAYSMFQITAEQ